ncbi:uncharacterized protein N0V89_005863 [Didymosphaeria variabile]|uniref:Uncharacterized protein n=1 Tax=Didymosphaeria variabile TaxID=1932322 RepID=A0A9W8XLI3_9PLEO|nr:uncharacterized protein N0V89_005863 [Didymosphaeria variabile]KAJ4354130.1 hypothetical protein N0V89_005863 [Didymosphaeria variabile]
MKLTLWVVLALLTLCLAFQQRLEYTDGGDLNDTEIARRCLYNAFFQSNHELGVDTSKRWSLLDTATWGYKMKYALPPAVRNLGADGLPPSSYGIARALDSLRISNRDWQDGGSLTTMAINHFDATQFTQIPAKTLDQQTYPKPRSQTGERNRYTGMYLTWGYSVANGVIYNLFQKSTVTAASERIPLILEGQLPELRNMADLQYVTWESSARALGPEAIKKLEWYFVASILNEETRQIIRGALMHLLRTGFDEPLLPWPGRWISITTNSGLAILGSELGKTLGYFLAFHKENLGNMWVDGVVVFHGDTDHKAACLAFHVRQPARRPFLQFEFDLSDPGRNPPDSPQRMIPDPRGS